jgi:hypothetical protein
MSYRVRVSGTRKTLFWNNVFIYKLPAVLNRKLRPKEAEKIEALKQELELFKTYHFLVDRSSWSKYENKSFVSFDELLSNGGIVQLPHERSLSGSPPQPSPLYDINRFFSFTNWNYSRLRIMPYVPASVADPFSTKKGMVPLPRSKGSYSQACVKKKLAQFIQWRLLKVVEVTAPVLADSGGTSYWQGHYRLELA